MEGVNENEKLPYKFYISLYQDQDFFVFILRCWYCAACLRRKTGSVVREREKIMNRKNWIIVLIALMVSSCLMMVHAGNVSWPKDIDVDTGTFTMYSPQVETFKENILTARSAVAFMKNNGDEPVFGVIWFESRVSSDRTDRLVEFQDFTVIRSRFPGIEDDKATETLNKTIRGALAVEPQTMSQDEFLAQLEIAELSDQVAQELHHDPPRIIHVTDPSILVSLDGKPRFTDIEGTPYKHVTNTPFLIVSDPGKSTLHLYANRLWYSARDIQGPWQVDPDLPDSITGLIQKKENDAEDTEEIEPPDWNNPPKIIIATESTELIVTDGRADLQMIPGTDLLYVKNTDNNVFVYSPTSDIYTLISGRWFTSSSTDGPWAYVTSDALPDDFARIPEDSPRANILAHVAGTDEARDAVYDAYIPQTSAVKKDEVKPPDVTFDGKPKFEKISGTPMTYGVNTGHSVIFAENAYYCCHEAVWYVASKSTGPYVLCSDVPDVIYTIPPECPVYNVRYVRVYQSTPQVVYVGYTPGYTGSYISGGTVVYGTGHIYRPWYGSVYYPRPSTWGMSLHYTPYYGWGMGVHYHYSVPGFSFGISFGSPYYRPPYYRPPYYRPPYYRPPHYRPPAYRPPHHRPPGHRPPVHRPPSRPPVAKPPITKPGHRPSGTRPSQGQGLKKGSGKDLYADRDGNVHRRNLDGWEQNTRDGWKPSDSGRTKPVEANRKPSGSRPDKVAPRPAPTRSRTQDLNRHQKARQQGKQRQQARPTQRSAPRQQSRPAPSRSHSSRGRR